MNSQIFAKIHLVLGLCWPWTLYSHTTVIYYVLTKAKVNDLKKVQQKSDTTIIIYY